MHCPVLLLFLSWFSSQFTTVVPLCFLPPPLLVTCSNPQHRVHQMQDNELHVSCFWDGDIHLKYSRAPGLTLETEREEAGLPPAPLCRWYRDSVLVSDTNRWSGELVMGGQTGGGRRALLNFTQITVQCVSASSHVPACVHKNLSIEMSGQDVHLFLLSPHTLPILEWQPVELGWCARLKSSMWSYRFKSPGGRPVELLIPSDHHSEPPTPSAYPRAELRQVCASYYSYYTTVRYPHRGFYTASLRTENGPQLNHSLDLHVQSALLHVFSASSNLLSLPHRTLSLSWMLRPLGSGITAYTLMGVRDVEEWYQSSSYNPFALQRDFCAAPKPQNPREKLLANIYFRTDEITSGGLTGKLDFSNGTLVFTANSTSPIHLTLNPQKIKVGTYIFSHALGLYYSSQESSAANTTGEGSSSHYIFYQQQSLSYLIIVEFVQQQWYRFSLHMYLNRREALFKALGEKGIEVHVFNGHSPDESLVYVVWFIPAQHPLLQCEWAFSLQLFDSRKEQLLWSNNYTHKDHVHNASHFLPRSVLPFKPSLYTGFAAQVNCRKTGIAQAVLKATVNTYTSKIMEPAMVCQKSYCHEVTAIIQKPNPSNPVMHRTRKSKISLQATTKAVCQTHSNTEIFWNIYKLQTLWNPPDWSNALKTSGKIRQGDVTFHIPAYFLVAGLYLINMTMTVHLPAYNIKIRESDSVFLQIQEGDLVANIAGGYFRTVGVSDRWTLDGSASFDPDSANPHEGIQFNWYCSKREMDYITMRMSSDAQCHPAQTSVHWSVSNHPVQIVEPNTLQENTKYYMVLIIQKEAKTAHTYQTVHVVPGSAPALNVTCFENCGKAVKATERLILSGKCLNCEKARRTAYLWTLLSTHSNEIYFDWASKTTTGRSSPSVHINPLAFDYKPDTFYTLSLKVSTQGKQPSMYKYSFYVHTPPQIGKCIIYPRAGTAFHTKFIIHCSGFEDKNGPLTYKVIAHSNPMKMAKISSVQKNTFGTIVYVGHSHKTPPSFLPVGTPLENYALVIYVQVHDVNGVFSQVILQATVHPPSKPVHIILRELRGLIDGPNAPLSIFLTTKDYLNLGYFVHMAASMLNNIETSPTIHRAVTDLRRILLNLSVEIPMTAAELISQVVSSICQITQQANAINSDAQLLAVKKLKEASGALKVHRSKDLGSKDTEILGSGILTGLSNVLRASLLNNGSVSVAVVKEIISVTEALADLVLLSKVPGEYETSMEAEGWTVHLWKNEKWEVSGSFFKRQKCKNCFRAKLKQEDNRDLLADAVVSTVLQEFDKNPFPWLTDATDIRTAVTGFKMVGAKANGDTIGITPEVVEMIMDRKDKDSATFGLTLGVNKTSSQTTGGFSFEINRSSKDILVQILCDTKVTFSVSVHLGLNVSSPPIAAYTASFDKSPVPSEVDSNITDCAFKAPYILCLPQSLLWSPGSQEDKWNISIVLHAHPIVRSQTLKRVRIALFTANCLELDEVQNQWKEGTCSLGPLTSWSKIHCICKTRERSVRATSPQSTRISSSGVQFVAGKIILYPNPLDTTKILLAEFDTNPVPLFTVFFIFTGYIFCVIWTMNKDKSDQRRTNKILVLPDNDPYHSVRYLVTIYTGSRLGSGTTADVYIELTGKDGASDVHHLKHPQFPSFFRTAVDTFLLTTMTDIGDIVSIHVWHNNGGSSPDWYLSRVKVYNAHTKKSWLFICRSWFGLGRGDCKIERTFEPSIQDSPLNKADYFMIKLAKDLEENHEWLSIFAQVVTGTFTRVQRLSCCLTILLCTLLLNIMFFSNKEVIGPAQMRYMQSIYIGVVSALVIIPLQVCITWFFKYSKEKPKPNKPGVTKPQTNVSFLSETPAKENNSGGPQTSEEKTEDLPDKDTDEDNKLLNKVLMFFLQTPEFPWWFRYVAWFLVFTVSGLASIVIILYGLTYGYTTSIEWFIASLTSFCESVFLLQTLKMVLFSAMSTINLKYLEKIPWITTEQYQEMQLVRVSMDDEDPRQVHRELARRRRTREYQPMKEDEVIVLRKRVKAQHLAFVFVKDIVCHIVFSSCVFSLTYETETTTAFYYNQIIYKKFSPGLSNVNKLEHIYMWMNDVFVPLIHNDYYPTYLSDTWSKILGSPRMRQKRAKNITKTCFSPRNYFNNLMISKTHCRYQHDVDPEDQTDYLGSWTAPTTESTSNHSSSYKGFTYQSVDQWEYTSYGVLNTYGTGGYSFYFFPHEQRPNTTKRLEDLQRNKWLDDKTWAVIFELTTFNADVDLYCSVTVIFELSDMGIVNTSLSVHSYKLSIWTYQTISQMFAHGVLTYILVFYLADEFLLLQQERLSYLQTATNVQNLAIKSMSFMFILLIALKFKLAGTLLNSHLVNPEEFVPFHVVSQIDQLYRVVAGLLAFLLVLKPYRYFRFLYKVRLAERTLAAALPTFVYLSMTAVLFFSIYMLFGHLIFGQYNWDYNTYLHAFQSVVSYCFAPSRQAGLPSNLWLEMFFRVTLFFSLAVLFANLWRAELIWTYTRMKQPVYEQHSDEAEAINFVVLKIQSTWFLMTRHPSATTDQHPFTNVIFGKPVTTEDQQQGLRTRQIDGEKKETYLVI
ncbi:polycystin family receptor for egg jelly-like [Tiliqua scincoides]|uniref:polycystin family receptor for egg jelly-like n=1 Tax=Tiliqua scincoides TaxID=71010 RepID=UPI0034618439